MEEAVAMKDIFLALINAGAAGIVAASLLLFGFLNNRAEQRRHDQLLIAHREDLEAERESHQREISLIVKAHEESARRIVKILHRQTSVLERLTRPSGDEKPVPVRTTEG